jgi:hypothetical protein
MIPSIPADLPDLRSHNQFSISEGETVIYLWGFKTPK